jgi:hypothetical protein
MRPCQSSDIYSQLEINVGATQISGDDCQFNAYVKNSMRTKIYTGNLKKIQYNRNTKYRRHFDRQSLLNNTEFVRLTCPGNLKLIGVPFQFQARVFTVTATGKPRDNSNVFRLHVI